MGTNWYWVHLDANISKYPSVDLVAEAFLIRNDKTSAFQALVTHKMRSGQRHLSFRLRYVDPEIIYIIFSSAGLPRYAIGNVGTIQGLYSLSGRTSYRQISWSLEAARLGVIMIVSLWNLTGISVALLPRCLLNFRAIGKIQIRISRFRDFTRSCGRTSYRLVNRGPGLKEGGGRKHGDPKASWLGISFRPKSTIPNLLLIWRIRCP